MSCSLTKAVSTFVSLTGEEVCDKDNLRGVMSAAMPHHRRKYYSSNFLKKSYNFNGETLPEHYRLDRNT